MMSIAAPEPKANMGQPVPRYDAAAKVTGKAQYAADVQLNNPVYAYLVTSSIAKGRIDFAVVARQGLPKQISQDADVGIAETVAVQKLGIVSGRFPG